MYALPSTGKKRLAPLANPEFVSPLGVACTVQSFSLARVSTSQHVRPPLSLSKNRRADVLSPCVHPLTKPCRTLPFARDPRRGKVTPFIRC